MSHIVTPRPVLRPQSPRAGPECRAVNEEDLQYIATAFRTFDPDDTKTITYRELKVALRALGFTVKKGDVLELLQKYEKDETSRVTFEEFNSIMIHKIESRSLDEELGTAFKVFDDDDSGKISLSNLKRIAHDLGDVIPEDELRAMIVEFDKDGDGAISRKEFANIMKYASVDHHHG
eukprot:CAMPEP_0198211898 /NCGR_PEP_ID=MMETSP1445-20131203/25410_1 /TAXON_ID=36898 /ORGANISM="Pyramimonas sp., Strain CCMP2087" /LENGTH=176 /DNA_ID=CAMNT_0043886255 /DNA_START=166 /DNA_END=696 /DNA_ORIENTATION=-